MRIWLNSMLLTVFATAAFGVSPCPTVGASTYQGDNSGYLSGGGGCNVLVTVNANGTSTVTTVNASPYDGSDDTLVGVVNNGTTALSQLTISGTGISEWDGDGICVFAAGGLAQDTWTSGNSSYCSSAQLNGTDPQDYAGPNQTFTNFASGDTLTVLFNTPIPAGGTAFFSLEEAPNSTTLTVSAGSGPTSTPAPASLWLIAIGFCAMGTYYFQRTRLSRN